MYTYSSTVDRFLNELLPAWENCCNGISDQFDNLICDDAPEVVQQVLASGIETLSDIENQLESLADDVLETQEYEDFMSSVKKLIKNLQEA